MNVQPSPKVEGSNVSPEFEIDGGDGPIIVEVHSRQLDVEEAAKLYEDARELGERHSEEIAKERSPGDIRNIVTMSATEVFPTGAPKSSKAGDSSVTNTISRIAAIKQNEKQVDPTKPFILWLDFQDPGVWGFPIADELFSPVYSETREGEVACGPLWYALYGRRGDPLLYSRGYRYAIMPLAHDGRFLQTMKGHGGPSRVSAVMFSTPRSTVLMENPRAIKRIPDRARAALLKTPGFRFDLSIMDWTPGLASTLTELQRHVAEAAAEKLCSFDAGA